MRFSLRTFERMTGPGFDWRRTQDDVNGLFAMTLSLGMQADYAGLIEKHQLESLRMIREADKFAKKLLTVAPDAADAYLTLGRRELYHRQPTGSQAILSSLQGNQRR